MRLGSFGWVVTSGGRNIVCKKIQNSAWLVGVLIMVVIFIIYYKMGSRDNKKILTVELHSDE